MLKTEELTMPMTHAGYNRMRLGLGEWDPENTEAEGVMLTDRSLWQDESGQFDPNKRVDVKVRMRGLAMERMGYQIAQAWDTGHGRCVRGDFRFPKTPDTVTLTQTPLSRRLCLVCGRLRA
jgi:hypothetical protein